MLAIDFGVFGHHAKRVSSVNSGEDVHHSPVCPLLQQQNALSNVPHISSLAVLFELLVVTFQLFWEPLPVSPNCANKMDAFTTQRDFCCQGVRGVEVVSCDNIPLLVQVLKSGA